MSKAIKKYECAACYEYHDTETSARSCCDPAVVYVCGTCGTGCDRIEDAAHCCLGYCPKCEIVFDESDIESECDLGFEPVFHCTQCGWRTGDAIPVTACELEHAGQLRIIE